MDYIKEVESFIRKSLSEENEAVSVYVERSQLAKKLADEVRQNDIELAKKLDDISYVINDIKEEEEVHIGELKELLSLIGVSEENEDKGEEEAEEAIEETFLSISKKFSTLL